MINAKIEESWKITASQEIFHSPDTVDIRENTIITYICASNHEMNYDVTIIGEVSKQQLAVALRNLADRLVQLEP
jgi:hypothetical protein